MNRLCCGAVAVIASLIGFASVVPASESTATRVERTRLEELERTGARIRDAILRKDVAGVLAYVRPDQDDFTYDMVKRDLEDSQSWLYGNLFDSELLRHHAPTMRPRLAVRDYLARAEHVKLVVGFYEDKGQKKEDWGWLMFRSSNFSKKHWPLATFYYTRGQWWITDLFEHQP